MSIKEVKKAFPGDTYNQEYKLVLSSKNSKTNAEIASILQNYELVIRSKKVEPEFGIIAFFKWMRYRLATEPFARRYPPAPRSDGNGYKPEQKKDEANTEIATAAEIRQLLKQLERSYSTTTAAEQITLTAKAIEKIENNPTLKRRAISALRTGEIQEFEEAIGHPAAKIIIAVLQGWQEDP